MSIYILFFLVKKEGILAILILQNELENSKRENSSLSSITLFAISGTKLGFCHSKTKKN